MIDYSYEIPGGFNVPMLHWPEKAIGVTVCFGNNYV